MANPKQKRPGNERKNSTFTKTEEIFIVEQFAKLKSPKAVKNAFVKQFKGEKNSRWLWKLRPQRFTEIYERFKANGIQTANHSKQVRGVVNTDPAKVNRIIDHFIEFPFHSLKDASVALDIPKSTIGAILKRQKFKAYKINVSQVLTAAHKQGRLKFCQWLLEQPEGFVDLIFFGDKKWFQLSQHPNRQNVRYWAPMKPNFVFDSKNQNVKKIMAFVVVVDGRALPVFWHEDENGDSVSVNTDRYILAIQTLLKNFPKRKLKKCWWQQDGASCHCSDKSLSELKKHFQSRLISRRSEIEWPAHSPDLNPLDFTFWGQAMVEVFKEKPETISDLKTVVENYFNSLSPEFIKNCVRNIIKRAEICVKQKGGHFEHLM